jgi:hypothetical protein
MLPKFQLGIHDLDNSLTEIEFPKWQGKMKNTYSMGNGIEVKSAKKAADLFLCREFPEIANCNVKPHDPIFVPDIFIFNAVKTEVRPLNSFNSKKQPFKINLVSALNSKINL